MRVAINLYKPHPPSRVVVVATGVDTLTLWTRAPLREARCAELVRARALSESMGAPERVELAGVELEVRPHRLRKGSVLAESDFFSLIVGPDASHLESTAKIEIRALKLWGTGWRRAADQAEAVLREVCEPGHQLETQVARCDVTVDFQGWAPTPSDRARFRCQSANRARYYARRPRPGWESREVLMREVSRAREVLGAVDAETPLDELVSALERLHQIDSDLFSEFDSAGELTGYTFGRGGAVSARLYDKTREILRSRKGHMRAVWRRHPDFREQQQVWRLEFQLMREGLRTLEINTPGGWADLGEWAHLRSRVDAVWAYCSGRWLWHGTRTAKVRRSLSACWRALNEQAIDQGYERPEPCWRTDLERVVLKGAVLPVHAGLAGYLTSAVAHELELADDVIHWGEAAHRAVEAAVKDATMRGVGLMERAWEKRERLADKRAHLRERRHPHARQHELLTTREPGADG